jgi:hypothetical protein
LFVFAFSFSTRQSAATVMGESSSRVGPHNWANVFGYSLDHGGKYPEGNSLTEVLTKLIEGGYANDPTVFYVPLSGKVEATDGQKLKPENVCWDVTSRVDSGASDSLPLDFLTGYRVKYVPGGDAVSLYKPYPPYLRTWSGWWNFDPGPSCRSGIAVNYKNGNAVFIRLNAAENFESSIPNLVPYGFDAKAKAYYQLTPNGVLH